MFDSNNFCLKQVKNKTWLSKSFFSATHNNRRFDGKDLESLRSHLSRNFAENCGRFWKTSTFVSSSQWRALRTFTPWLIVTLVAMVTGKMTPVNLPPEMWEARGSHDKKASQRKQNLLRPHRCFWVTLKVRTKCLFFVTSHREVTLSR